MRIHNLNTHEILAQCDKKQVNLLLVAEKAKIDLEELIYEAEKQQVKIAGGVFPMVIYQGQHADDIVILKKITSGLNPAIIEGVGKGVTDHDFPELIDSIESCIVLLDGLMLNIPDFLSALFGKYWNKLNYIGAGCGSLSLQQTPCVFNNKGLFQDAALLIFSESKCNLGVKHGWKKIAGPFVANKTDGNKIIELNWRPAFEVYKEIVEEYTTARFESTDFFHISKGFPFGIYKEGKEDVVRDPIAIDENGAIVCVGGISQNVSLNILKGEDVKLIESAEQAAVEAASNDSIRDLLVVDCISRVLYLNDRFKDELVVVQKQLNNQVELEGVLSIGEISSDKSGYLELYNKTIVVSAFQ